MFNGWNIRDVIGLSLVYAFISAIFGLMFKAIPVANEQLIVYMLGQLSGFVAGVVALHYVTKAGEKELDAKRVDNTTKALDAIKAAQESTPQDSAVGTQQVEDMKVDAEHVTVTKNAGTAASAKGKAKP